MATSPGKWSVLRTIVTAWLVVGSLDISSAFVIWISRGRAITRGLQVIASGLLGSRALQGGMVTAGVGLALHFFIALVVVAVFCIASRAIPTMKNQAVLAGVLYGIAVYLVMYWIVLPNAFPKFRHSLANDSLEFAIHIVLIGLPTALIARRS
ncbi:MAG: hypothetical protein ACREIF_13785 [Chthoniobacterales bacterium]